jgi:predicted ribosomally synthesized peptide with nif11-like leader
MSKTEFERFNADLAADPALQAEAKAAATGLASLVAFATQRGYDVTLDDASSYIKARAQQLSPEELDALSGGTGMSTTVVASSNFVVSTASNVVVTSDFVVSGVASTTNTSTPVAQITIAEVVCSGVVAVN